jgi:hypothetical protein
MQVRDAYPVDAVTGGDFITGGCEVKPGDRVVDFDTDLDALPSWGRLCVHENTVKLMMTALGWEYDENAVRKIKEQATELARLRKVNRQMRDALVAVVEAATEAGVLISPDADPVPA